MSLFRTLLAGLFLRGRTEDEMEEELRFHIENRVADLESRGLSSADAKRRARLEFGSIDSYKERIREERGFRIFDELRMDIRFTVRTLRNDTRFVAIAALSLALGIGVNLFCFASLYSIVLHPFPYPDLGRIMSIRQARTNVASEHDTTSPADFLRWQRNNHSFESLAAYLSWDVNLTGVDHPEHIQAARVSSEFFQVLGSLPASGRTFVSTDYEPGHDAVAVVSHDFWQNHLASSPDAVGELIALDGRKYRVIGVMPEQFNLPLESALWTPLALTVGEKTEHTLQSLSVIGKLRPGLSQAQANIDLNAIAHLGTNEGQHASVISLREAMMTESNHFLLVLMCAALFVLLLACTNVGSLQVARALARQKEIGLRRALGASNLRIIRLLFIESLVVGLAGGALGIALAACGVKILRSSFPPMAYRIVAGMKDMRINGEVVACALFLSIAASVLCCLPIVFQILRSGRAGSLNTILREGERSSGASPARIRLRKALIITEVALAFVLLVSAGLMIGTLQRMVAVNLGYNPNNVLTAGITLSGGRYQKPQKIIRFYDNALRDLAKIQDVESVAAVGDIAPIQSISIEGRKPPRSDEPLPTVRSTTPQYLRTMKIPLLKGRWISEQDSSEELSVVVLSASMAYHYWPVSNPIGSRIKLGGIDSPWLTIIGVAGDVNDWFLIDPIPMAYLSYRQFPQTSMQLLVRSLHDPHQLAADLRATTQALDREQPIYNLHTIDDQLHEETSGVRNATKIMSVYALIALLLAVTGVYSISSFFAIQRTHEIGVRVSLGAPRQSILKMMLTQS